jgi:DNA-binding NtrC family response regulator
MMQKPVTFLVVDDHPVFRQGLVALIRSNERYRVCAEAGTAAESLSALAAGVPDIALIDISLVGQSGLDLVKTLKAAHPEVIVLIISMHDEVVYAERALKAGARGYVMKQEAASVMVDAIETVLSVGGAPERQGAAGAGAHRPGLRRRRDGEGHEPLGEDGERVPGSHQGEAAHRGCRRPAPFRSEVGAEPGQVKYTCQSRGQVNRLG